MVTKNIYILFSILLSMVGTKAFAYSIAVPNADGVTIYYNYINDGTELEVTYKSHSNEASNAGYTGFGSLAIPEEVTYLNKTRKVTRIGDLAFWDCTDLTSITIPNSVTTIGKHAFSGSGLTSITIPNSMTTIGEHAFGGCPCLTSVTIPNSVTVIRSWAFQSCRSLTSITIPNSVISIGEEAFNVCTSLTSITIPNSVKYIGLNPFKQCIGLTSIVVEDGNPKYDSRNNCNAIIETSSNTLITGCANTVIPDDVTNIGEGAFLGLPGLTSIIIPNSVTSIGEGAFGASGLTSITIPNGVTSIEHSTFACCRDLTSVTIPNSVTSIGEIAFQGCWSLTSITIPNSVKSIERFAIDGCKSLTSLTIGSGIKSIAIGAFSDCPKLADVYCYSTTLPTIDDNAFRYTNIENAILHVPASSIKRYNRNEPWKYFKEVVMIKPMHTLTYIVDDEVYKSYQIEEDANITPEPAPTKDGYTFSGWDNVPSTMPANDVTVTGTFTQVKFTVDNATYEITDDGTVAIADGGKTGDVTIEATIKLNGQTYQVTAISDNAFKDNENITSVTIPEGITTIGDNAFNGCTGLIVINIGKNVLSIGSKAFANVGTGSSARTRGEESSVVVNCYAESVPQTSLDAFENTPIETGTLYVNDNLTDVYKTTLPWSRFGKIIGFEEVAGIKSISNDTDNARIYDLQGNRLDNVRRGVNIIRMKDGKTKKVMVK